MAAGTCVVRFRSRADKRIIMAAGAGGRCYNDASMARIGRMQCTPRTCMTGGTVTASGRNTRLEVRNGCMAESTISAMCYINCSIRGSARIMTARAGRRSERHIPYRYVVNTAMNR